MACIVSYRALFTTKNRHTAKSPAAMPLKQYHQGDADDHGHSRFEKLDGHKPSQTGQMDSWTTHGGDGVEVFPRDMTGVRSDIVTHSEDDKISHMIV